MVKVCKNYKSKTYTGKENTPLGKGYHAEGEKINKIMKGKDGNMYKVIKTKSGKRWLKVNIRPERFVGTMKGIKIIKNKSSPRRTKRGFGGDLNPDFMSTRYNDMQYEQKLYKEYEKQGLDKGLEGSDLKLYIKGKMDSYKLRLNQFKNSKDVCDYFVKMEEEKGVKLSGSNYDRSIEDLVKGLGLNCSYENKKMLITMLSNKYQGLDEENKLKSSKKLINNYRNNLQG